MKRKASLGIGSMVILIALILIGVIASAVLLQTSSSFKETSYKTASQARNTIATSVRFVEVSAEDGTNARLTDFVAIVRLASGSTEIKIDESTFAFSVDDITANLLFAGDSASNDNGIDGYYTLNTVNISYIGTEVALSDDYDDDGIAENISGGAGGSDVVLGISSGDSVNLGNCNGGAHDNAPNSGDYINSATIICSGNDPTRVIIVPKNIGIGKFSISYLQTGQNHIIGNMKRGDIIKIFFEAPREIENDEDIRMIYIPSDGHPTMIEFTTPQVIRDKTIFLYP
jgi:archaellin